MTIKNNYLPSKRSFIEKFFVMDVLSKSRVLEDKGKKVYHLELGEPINFVPKKVNSEITKALHSNLVGYTPSNGIFNLRKKIAQFYKTKDLEVEVNDIFVTVGSSGAFLLTFLSCFDPGDTVVIFNPSYPAYKNILKSLNIKVVEIEANSEDNFKIHLDKIKKFKNINGVIISSPNNPTGQIFDSNELEFIYKFCKKNKIYLISDEIYHGIEFDKEAISIRRFGNTAIIINSFSKFFCLPGWRIGWVILTKSLRENFLKLTQNLFISTGSISQIAALKALDCINEYENKVKIYKKNRNFVFKQLNETPWNKFSHSNGSFYTYINISDYSNNSKELADKILNSTGIALTPGIDFDSKHGHKTLRLSFSNTNINIEESLIILKNWINKNY